jgi:hypothetical protein
MRFFGLLGLVPLALAAVAGCSSHNSIQGNADAGSNGDASLTDNNFAECPSTCATACSPGFPICACGACLANPKTELARGTGLHYFSTPTPTAVDVGCLTSPGTLGKSQNVTMTGYVKVFSSAINFDTQNVKIEVFKEGPDGTLVTPPLGSKQTSASDPVDAVDTKWLQKCQPDGCKFRDYSIPNIPTETPLIIKTSDAQGAGNWNDLYDYNVYFKNADAQPGADGGAPSVSYNVNAVTASDPNTVASAAGGLIIAAGKGVIAGEVHDCGDVRLSGATVETDAKHDGPMFYFDNQEDNPLPNLSAASTSNLGLFGALNFAAGTPIRISAVGQYQGQDVLLGTYVVQVFPGAVTALSFKGRRPWQQ